MSILLRVAEFDVVEVEAELLLDEGRLRFWSDFRDSEFFSVEVKRSGLALRARGLVGVFPINDRITLEVFPRFSVENLSRFIEKSELPFRGLKHFNKNYTPEGAIFPSLLFLYASSLHAVIVEIRARGLLKRYELKEDFSSSLTGRIHMGRTYSRATAKGLHHKVTHLWFERTSDIAVNKLLLEAVYRLSALNNSLHLGGSNSETIRVSELLNNCKQMLPSVTRDASCSFLRDPLVAGLQAIPDDRCYYRDALELAKVILHGQGVDFLSSDGSLAMPSLLLDMPRLFEAYLRNILRDGLGRSGWQGRILDGNRLPPDGGARKSLFDDGEDFQANPDVVISRMLGEVELCAGIVEVKYKKASSARPLRDDLEQALVYGVAYKAQRVWIVQPVTDGQESGEVDLGEFKGMPVSMYLFDLADDPKKQEEAFVSSVVRGLGQS